MRRICIFCQTWESGGIESFIHNTLVAMNLSELIIDVVVEKLKQSVFTDRLKALGIKFYELSGSTRNFLSNYCRFSRLMKERRYDVIHLNIYQALSLVYLKLAKKHGIAVRIAHSHGTGLRPSKTRVLKMAVHILCKRLFTKYADGLWACSEKAAKFMFPPCVISEKAWRFIPNGIDLARFQFNENERRKARLSLGLSKNFVIGHVGRLCEEKNQSFLLDIFARVMKQDPSARLLLVGEGESLAKLKEKAAQLSILEATIFLGATSCIEKLFWAMDVFVFPSLSEGLGLAAIEAQATGLPTICSDGIPPEAMASEAALQIPLQAPLGDWENAILTAKSQKRMFDAVGALKKRGFDINSSVQVILEVYDGQTTWDEI